MPIADSNFVKITIFSKRNEMYIEFHYTEYIHNRLKLLYGINVFNLVCQLLRTEVDDIIGKIDTAYSCNNNDLVIPYDEFKKVLEYMTIDRPILVSSNKRPDIEMLVKEILKIK